MQIYKIPQFEAEAGRVITARSYLIDRIVPACEVIYTSARKMAPASLCYSTKYGVTSTFRQDSRYKRWFTARPDPVVVPNNRFIIDLRYHAPSNWAHFLNNHLPLTFCLANQLGLSSNQIIILLPEGTPNYILNVAALFELEVICTNAQVSGHVIETKMEPWQAQRNCRHLWAQLEWPRRIISNLDIPSTESLLFISRRGTRKLRNEEDVTAALSARGYRKIYAEDLSPADQIAIISNARSVVAIHGAALAPLLYRDPNAAPGHVIELMPCGHMTDVYHIIAQQTGCSWIAVRGKIEPKHVLPAYDLGKGFQHFSLDSFEVDIESLNLAFDLSMQ